MFRVLAVSLVCMLAVAVRVLFFLWLTGMPIDALVDSFLRGVNSAASTIGTANHTAESIVIPHSPYFSSPVDSRDRLVEHLWLHAAKRDSSSAIVADTTGGKIVGGSVVDSQLLDRFPLQLNNGVLSFVAPLVERTVGTAVAFRILVDFLSAITVWLLSYVNDTTSATGSLTAVAILLLNPLQAIGGAFLTTSVYTQGALSVGFGALLVVYIVSDKMERTSSCRSGPTLPQRCQVAILIPLAGVALASAGASDPMLMLLLPVGVMMICEACRRYPTTPTDDPVVGNKRRAFMWSTAFIVAHLTTYFAVFHGDRLVKTFVLVPMRQFQPNPGLFWYIFQELFFREAFTEMFFYCFLMLPFAYVVPLHLKLRHSSFVPVVIDGQQQQRGEEQLSEDTKPAAQDGGLRSKMSASTTPTFGRSSYAAFLFVILVEVAAFHKPYVTLPDFAYALGLSAGLLSEASEMKAYVLLCVGMWSISSVLFHVYTVAWEKYAMVNVNYVYFAVLGFSVGTIVHITQLLKARIRRFRRLGVA